MKRTAWVAVLLLAACGGGPAGSATTPEPSSTTPPPASTTTSSSSTTTPDATASGFPVTVMDDTGPVTIEQRPESIVSLSATGTEMLFAIGAGDQVVAVDDQSNHPEEAPTTDLSGFTPNVEAILSYQPDLVIVSFDPADNPISEALEAVGVPTLMLPAAAGLEDVYRQMEVIGAATGNLEAAEAANREISESIGAIVADTADLAEGVTYFHELDVNLFTVTSQTFIGQIYGLLGMVNVADEADTEGSGYPQVSSEHIVAADPDIIFLADAGFGESAQTLAERPGWDGMTALERGAVVGLDSDIASRWGPRVVDFLETVSDAVVQHAPAGAASG